MNALAAYRRLLRNRALVRLFVGEFVSSIGDWLYLVALLIVVYERSGSATLLGLVGAARVVPYILLSVPAGIVADRYERRLVLLATDGARGVLMLGLAWLVAVDGPLPAIVALALLAACFSSFFGPTIGAYIPQLAMDESELGPANSAWASLDNLAFVVGPAIAGVLIGAGGLAPAFLLNAVSFGVIAVVLWRLPRGGGAEPRTADPGSGEAEQASEPRAIPLAPLMGLAALDSADRFVSGGLGVLTVILATQVLGAGEAATGYLNAAIGVGGFLGAIGSGVLVLRANLGVPLVAGGFVFALGVAALGVAPGLGLALAAMAVAAAGSLVMEVVATTVLQRLVPDALRGRTLGTLETVGTLSYAAGSLVLPVAAVAVGVPAALAASACILVAAVVVARLVARPAMLHRPAAAVTVEHLLRLPAFAAIPVPRLEVAARRMTSLPITPGQVVIRQGEPADRLYVIVRGTFLVSQALDSQERLLRRMGPDEVFGEIGLLRGQPRTATVAAESAGLLLALDGRDFLELVGAGSEVAQRFLDLHRGAAALASR